VKWGSECSFAGRRVGIDSKKCTLTPISMEKTQPTRRLVIHGYECQVGGWEDCGWPQLMPEESLFLSNPTTTDSFAPRYNWTRNPLIGLASFSSPPSGMISPCP